MNRQAKETMKNNKTALSITRIANSHFFWRMPFGLSVFSAEMKETVFPLVRDINFEKTELWYSLTMVEPHERWKQFHIIKEQIKQMCKAKQLTYIG